MKTIEEKAKAYDEAIRIAKSMYQSNETEIGIKDYLSVIFPEELAESEGERIREEIVHFLEIEKGQMTPQQYNASDKWIAWLEKQGKPKSIEWSGKIGSKHATGKLKEMIVKKENTAWSEDERIRKHLIKHFGNKSKEDWNGVPVKSIIAWLEKQGEPIDKIVKRATTEKQRVLLTETNGDAYIDWDTRSLQDVKLLLEYGLDYIKKLEKQGEQKLPIEKLPFEMKTLSESLGFTTQKECDDYNKMVTDLIMSDDDNGEQKELKKEKVDNLHNYLYGEQKPAWSEEDEAKRNALIDLVKEIKNQPLKRLEDWDGYISWLKSLKDKVQPKEEWSEEDELMLMSTIQTLKLTNGAAQMKVDWLKSLKDRYTWKPSEEQIKNRLEEQLRKLKE